MGWLESLFSGADAPQIRLADTSTSTITDAELFQIPMVQACRQLISDTVSSFTLQGVDRDGNALATNPLLLDAPSPTEPLGDFMERLVNDMTRHGRGWLEVTARDSLGWPLAVELVDPSRVQTTLTSNGQHIQTVQVDNRPRKPDDIIQVPMLLDGSPIGNAPLLAVKDAIDQLYRSYVFAGSMFGSGATPNYALKSATRLPPAQADALMRQWLDARSQNRPALLSGDLSLETFSGQTAAETQLHTAQNYLDTVIARLFQLPPTVVNAVANSSLTYATTTDENRRALQSINTGYLHRIETAFNRLLPSGVFCRFDSSDLTRLAASDVLDNTVKAYQAGLITLEEARTAIGREGATNGTFAQS